MVFDLRDTSRSKLGIDSPLVPPTKTSPERPLAATTEVKFSIQQADPKTKFMYITVRDQTTGAIGTGIISIKDISNPKDKKNKDNSLISVLDPEKGTTIFRDRIPLLTSRITDPKKLTPEILSKALGQTLTQMRLGQEVKNLRFPIASDKELGQTIAAGKPIFSGVDTDGNMQVLIPDSQKKIHLEKIKITQSGKVYRFKNDHELEQIGQMTNKKLFTKDGKTSIEHLSPMDRMELNAIIGNHFSKDKKTVSSPVTTPEKPRDETPAQQRPTRTPSNPQTQPGNPVDAGVKSFLDTIQSPEERKIAEAKINAVRQAPRFKEFSPEQQYKYLDVFIRTPNLREQLTGAVNNPNANMHSLFKSDLKGTLAIDHIASLANIPAPAGKIIALSLLGTVLNPETQLRQQQEPNCALFAVQYMAARYNSGEYARIVSSLTTTGSVNLPNGGVINLPPRCNFKNAQDVFNYTFEVHGNMNRPGRSLNSQEIDRVLETLSLSGYRQLNAGAIGSRAVTERMQMTVANGKNPVIASIRLTEMNRRELQAAPNGEVVSFSRPFGPTALHAIVVTDIGPNGVTFYNPWGKEQKMTHQAFSVLVNDAIVPDATAFGSKI